MSETIPVLSVGRQVANIGPDQITGLRERLLEGEEGPQGVPEGVREAAGKLLVPNRSLYSWIIAEGEFLRIQRNLGEDRLGEGDVAELDKRIKEALSQYPDELEADTLPARPKHVGPKPKRALTIANGMENVAERHTAQGVISHFLGYRYLPKGWFSRARKIVPVELASSGSEEELRLLKRLEVIIGGADEAETDGGVGPEAREEDLPDKTRLGKIFTEVSARYVRD